MNNTLLVVDASVAVKWYVPEDLSEQAQTILDRCVDNGLELAVPDLICTEVGNALWKRQRSADPRVQIAPELANEHVAKFLSDLDVFGFDIVPTDGLLADAYALACQHDHPLYDAVYVALSKQRNCRLVTADKALHRIALSSNVGCELLSVDWQA